MSQSQERPSFAIRGALSQKFFELSYPELEAYWYEYHHGISTVKKQVFQFIYGLP